MSTASMPAIETRNRLPAKMKPHTNSHLRCPAVKDSPHFFEQRESIRARCCATLGKFLLNQVLSVQVFLRIVQTLVVGNPELRLSNNSQKTLFWGCVVIEDGAWVLPHLRNSPLGV